MTLLALEDLCVTYGVGTRALRAVRGVNLTVDRGETLGLVGESGCGKSSIARAIVGLVAVSSGRVLLNGEDVTGARRRHRKEVARRVQVVFQDPYSSLNPRMSVRETLTEAMLAHRPVTRPERDGELGRLLDLVALGRAALDRHPHEFSGGQRQRIAIARALAVKSEMLIADEITSALDVSVQASILNLLRDIQRETGVGCLFISHDLSVVRYVSARVAVMHLGRIVEHGPSSELFVQPQHPYTCVLLDSLSSVSRSRDREPLRALREPVDPHVPPTGCDFHPRCPLGPGVDVSRRICAEVDPQTEAALPSPAVACHFPVGAASSSRRVAGLHARTN